MLDDQPKIAMSWRSGEREEINTICPVLLVCVSGCKSLLPLTALATNSWIYFLLATHLDISVHTVSPLTKIHCSGFPECQRACVWCHCYRGYKHYKATQRVLLICGCSFNECQILKILQ